jgi:ATP synthase protein I
MRENTSGSEAAEFKAAQGWDDEPAPVVLSAEQLLALDREAGRDMMLMLAAQAVTGLLVVALAGVWAGSTAALSALLGAGAYWFLNALFALRLRVNAARSVRANPYVLLFGELVKLFLTALLLGVVAWYAKEWLVWPAMLAGLVLTMKGYLPLFVLWRKRLMQ